MTNPKLHALFSFSTHHNFALNIDTAVCDANLQGRKGSVASCGGVEAWHFLGWNSNEWPCSFRLPLMCCPLSELEVWDARAVQWECVCAVRSVPSCRHAVRQVQYYKSSVTVWPVCLFCSSEEERSCNPFYLPLVSIRQATLFLHWTSHLFKWKPGASAQRLMKRAAASLGAPCQPGWHALTTGFEKAFSFSHI